MPETETYEIVYVHETGARNRPDPLHEELSQTEFDELRSNLHFQRLISDVEKAYELIVLNYRDFELSTYSMVLEHVLTDKETSTIFVARSEIDRHLSNMLSATYLYTCLLKIRGRNDKLDDYSFHNSSETLIAHELKTIFENITNKFHAERYQYTLMSALRNIINHGGTLEKVTTLGGEWSISYNETTSDSDVALRKDTRYTVIDQEISKAHMCSIVSAKHYKHIEQSVPDSINMREAVRIYVDLLSVAHSEVRKYATAVLGSGDDLIRVRLSKHDDYNGGSIIKRTDGIEVEIEQLRYSDSYSRNSVQAARAPLNLEDHPMPGESAAVPKRKQLA